MVNHLVILPCHSIWAPLSKESVGLEREEWQLVNFQIEGYDHLCFKEHIEKSIELIKEDEEAQLIISGGQTKKQSGPISESQSYYQLAHRLYHQSIDEKIWERISTEEFARDSFENVIYSLCRFYELYGKYPAKISIVGFAFKKNRFIKHHLGQALRWQNIEQTVKYVGNAPDPRDTTDKTGYFRDLDESEDKFAVKLFENDWYCCRSKLLDKKMQRNPFKRYHGYGNSNLPLEKFLKAIDDFTDSKSNEEISLLLEGLPWTTKKN